MNYKTTIIYLTAKLGVGKYTIAKQLEHKVTVEHCEARQSKFENYSARASILAEFKQVC